MGHRILSRCTRVGIAFLVGTLALASTAHAQQSTAFGTGSLIIPMDIDYQDAGMLRAYGLLYRLLKQNVPVSWCVAGSKTLYTGTTAFPASASGAVDFYATAKDLKTSNPINNHGYRGGPFVIDSSNAAQAIAIINAYNATTPTVTVHQATASFTAPVSRQLINAPNIGINADGNEAIAFGYLGAASIPDSLGNAWSDASPDVMTPTQIAGATTTSHSDGKLFGKTGLPVYCQLMSMHWDVKRNATNDEAVAEMSAFLGYPTHLFAECQAVNMIEDDNNGHFVSSDNGTGEPASSIACFKTPDDGLCAATQPKTVTFMQSFLPFAQLDGPFTTENGSEPSYGWAPGSSYYDTGIVMMRGSTATGPGQDDLWMTGFAHNGTICQIGHNDGIGGTGQCAATGKVSYLGGHQYTTATPMTKNPTSQGVRLFLNSLFEAGCTTAEGQPSVTLTKSAPATTYTNVVTFTLGWSNSGQGVAVGAVLTDPLPSGATFVSATGGGVASNGTVTWTLGELGPMTSGSVSVTVLLASYGSYANTGTVTFRVGNNGKSVASNQTVTVFEPPPDMTVLVDLAGSPCASKTCPGPSDGNPCLTAHCDFTTGDCSLVNVSDGTSCTPTNDKCHVGTTCTSGVCGGGTAIECAPDLSPCKTTSCDPMQGCVTSDVGNGASCSTGNLCVTGETCTNGVCGGGASVTCPPPSTPCENATCDPNKGCGFAAGNDGAMCSTGDPCVSGSTCSSGLCSGGMTCPPSTSICTVDACTQTGCMMQLAASGTDPNGDCPAQGACPRSCDGNGACTTCGNLGDGCSGDAQCVSGRCVAGVCVDANADLGGSAGDASVADDAAATSGDAAVTSGDASATSGDASVSGDATVVGDASVLGDAIAAGDASLDGPTSGDTGAGSSDGNGGSDGARASSDGTSTSRDLAGGGALDLSTAGGGATPSGCGCSVGEARRPVDGTGLAAGVLLAALWLVRRRRAARSTP